jgi:tRNA nucleotidyltransferase (CCA-adding enzyme)
MRGGPSAVDVRALVLKLIPERNRVRDWFRRSNVEDHEFRYLSARVEPKLVLALARARGQFEAADWFESRLAKAGVLDGPPQPLLLGRNLIELGVPPGPAMGEILQTVYLAQLRAEVGTLEEARELGLKLWQSPP